MPLMRHDSTKRHGICFDHICHPQNVGLLPLEGWIDRPSGEMSAKQRNRKVRAMNPFRTFFLSALAVAAVTGAAQADTIIPGTASIWLAGQPDGASVSGYFGSDFAPANSPAGFVVTGPTLTFSATGSTSVDDVNFGGPNGAAAYPDQSGFSPAPWGGLYNGPADALIGIFLDGSTPPLGVVGGYQGPLGWVFGLDYQNPANVGPGAYAPALNQIFLIGDGTGETFNDPVGGTELYLAVADSIGGSTGNLGSLDVTVTGATPAAPVPEPATLSLFGAALAGAVAMRRRKKKIA
jgi:hypothetical protein